MSRPRKGMSLRFRSHGKGSGLLPMFEVPPSLALVWLGVVGMVRHWKWTVRVLGFFVAWVYVGLIGAVLLGVLAWGCWTLWVRSNIADGTSAGGRALSVEDIRHRRTLQKQWGLACRAAKLIGPESHEPPDLIKLTSAGSGTFEATVECGKVGIPVTAVQKAADTLAAVITCREVVVAPQGLSVCKLSFHWRDPIGRSLPLADLPIAPDQHLAYGIRQDGSPATVRATQSVLIGGLTRMGKSNAVWALLADALRQGIPVDLFVSDPKGGVELDQLEAALGRDDSLVSVRAYAKTPAETVKMIAQAEDNLRARQLWMKKNGVRKVQPDRVNPLVVVILDETLPLTDILKKGTDSPLGKIAYTGAAAAYVVWANTQVAQVDAIGRFRDLIPQRICFATPNRQVTDSVLGDGSEMMGAACSDINEAGVGFSHAEGDKLARKFRAAMVSDAETRMIAEGRLPAKVVNNTREAYDRRAEGGVVGKSRGDRRTALYRWFADEDGGEYERGTLVYTGVSYDVLAREAQHNAGLRAFMEGNVRREVVWFDTRAEALAAEKLAIETEKPIFNQQHNGSNPRRALDRFKRDKVA